MSIYNRLGKKTIINNSSNEWLSLGYTIEKNKKHYATVTNFQYLNDTEKNSIVKKYFCFYLFDECFFQTRRGGIWHFLFVSTTNFVCLAFLFRRRISEKFIPDKK